MKNARAKRPAGRLFAFGQGVLLALTWGLTAGASPYAEAVVDSLVLPGSSGNSQTNPAAALGPPDHIELSMGGPGAFVVLDMGAASPIVDGSGPDLEVREIGAALGGEDENYLVYLSNATNPASFVEIGEGQAIGLFDIAGFGLSTARYVRIEDLSTHTLGSATPGSDIDSVTALQHGDLPPAPTGLQARLTGQGVLLSWEAPESAGATGFNIRRSLDGLSYSSTPIAELEAVELGCHDTSLPDVTNLWYAVATVTGTVESASAVVQVTFDKLPIMPAGALHLGDQVLSDWEIPDPTNDVVLTVVLGGYAEGPEAKLMFDVFDVDYGNHPVLVNHVNIGDLPTRSSESWAERSMTFPAGPLHPGTNTISLFARTSSGGTTGSLDDYMIRDVRLCIFGEETAPSSVLPWVVGYTPTMTPPAWEVISEPIRWKEHSASTTSFFRLQHPEGE